jgi:hypothetical protein
MRHSTWRDVALAHFVLFFQGGEQESGKKSKEKSPCARLANQQTAKRKKKDPMRPDRQSCTPA